MDQETIDKIREILEYNGGFRGSDTEIAEIVEQIQKVLNPFKK